MNENKSNIPVEGIMKNAGQKSITPAILGVASSHGIKLPLKMTSGNQKELLLKLEEWRKARREKLAASILAKQKQIEKSKTQISTLSLKNKSLGDDKSLKIKNRQSVFERLYKNSGKIKKTEITANFVKPSQIPSSNIRTHAVLSLEKTNKSMKVLPVRREKSEPFHALINSKKPAAIEEISMENHDLDAVDDIMKVKNQISEDNSLGICKENLYKTTKAKKPVICLMSDQISSKDMKSVKNVLDFKSLPLSVSTKLVEAEEHKYPLRRSISMTFRQKCTVDFGVRRSFSTKNLNEIDLNPQKNYSSLRIPSRTSRDSDKKAKNKVPTKSVSFVKPRSSRLTSAHLRTTLEDWLKMNGHALEGYRHLRCFDISNSYKPFPRDSAFFLEHSFENSHYLTAPNTPLDDSDKENLTPPTVVQQVDEKEVENWLKELHRLIVEIKYPSERCEEWLTAIRRKCSSCSQLPIYWECLAALHESKGDLKSAIEDYERAIIKGGEVDAVGNSLAELFDKLVIEQKKSSKRKLEKGLDPKNIFKSTIIKFALQQKALKKLSSEIEPSVRQQLYIATPVRRSTRIQTPFKTTEVSSLQTLTPELLKNLKFKPNESLLNRN